MIEFGSEGGHPSIDEPTRDEIDNETDEETLAEWYRDHTELQECIFEFVRTRREGMADLCDPNWLRKSSDKVAHLRIATRRIERRMIALGYRPPYHPTDPRVKEISRLGDQNRRLKALLRSNNIEIPHKAG